MSGEFEFQYPWVLILLALLPLYAFWRGRTGKLAALLFSSADLARAAGAKARSAAGRLLIFLRLLVVALGIVALAGPRLSYTQTETDTAALDVMLARGLSWSMMARAWTKMVSDSTGSLASATSAASPNCHEDGSRLGSSASENLPRTCCRTA